MGYMMKGTRRVLLLLACLVSFVCQDVQGAPPVFGSAAYSGTVNENVAIDTTVSGFTISATDSDGQAITISIISSPGPFKLKSDGTKILTNGESIDFETTSSYTLTIQALAGGETDNATVTITIGNINEAPSFALASYSGRIHENSVNGTDIITVTASDVDSGDTITYSLSGSGSSSFSALTTGVIEVSGSLDFEATPTYTLTLTATDTGGLTDTATLTISVDNVNESPVFTSASYAASVAENDAAASVVTVAATDPDVGNSVTYSLTGSGSSHFTVHPTSGVVILTQALDYETKPTYSLTVAASDGQGGLATTSLTITVTDANDAPISVSASYSASIEEDAPVGTNVIQTSATDVDSGDTISYSLSGSAHFSITGTGLIKTAESLDYETTSSYSLTVSFFDGTLSVTKAVSISVTNKNDAPVLPSSPYTASVSEGSLVGTAVYDVNATDADGDTLTYSLYGAGSSSFSISSATGVVTTAKALDYEAVTSYTLTIRVTDGNGGITETSLTVTITNSNDSPQFLSTPYNTAVDENLGTGTSVISVSAIDQDSGNTLTYSLSGTNNAHFSISSASGLVTTAQALDHEAVSSYSLTVSVSDGTVTVTTALVITVTNRNDAPAFSNAPYSASVAENNAGSAVYTVSATDEDSGDTMTYFISGTGSGDFSIDSSTGVVTLARALNYEDTTYYSLSILVLDGKGESDSTNLNITVTDANDAPVFLSTPYAAHISEGVAIGTNVLKATATDQDTSDTLTYALTGTNSAHFAVSSTGMISTAHVLDRESVSSYSLTLSVSDGTANVTQGVSITVVNANDVPVFTGAPYSSTVAEGDAAAAVYTASATDGDGDTLVFSLSGTGSTSFSMNPSTGVITLTAALNYETSPAYSLTIRADDGNGGVATTTLNITVTNQNDSPVFSGTPFSATLTENDPIGTTVLKVIAIDEDSADTLSYSLSGSNSAHFAIGSSTGVITTAQLLDRETVNSYSLTVSVSDGTATVNQALSVTINDANDAPLFTNAPYNATVNENAGSGSVYTVSATDADSDVIAYSIYGHGSDKFSIHSSSGLVTLASAVDFETKSSFVLTVQAADTNGAIATTSLYVDVVNQNDSPAFMGTPYSTSIIESVSFGTTVFRAQAVDEDTADTLSYSLSGTNNAHFAIGSSTGIITTAQALDYESASSYSLTVTVNDGTVSMTTPLTISIADVNDAPVFTSAPYTTSVNENEAGAAVYTVSGTDQDSGDSVSFTMYGSGSSYFTLHPTTGVVTLSRALDYETTPLYTLTIIASDTNQGLASTTLTVTVTDQNDEPKLVGTPYYAQVDENLNSGATVMKLTATDQDSNSTLSYTLTGSNNGHFSISATGLITTTQELDYETINTYSLNVSVTDGTTTVTEGLTITVRNKNDDPSFTSAPYSATVTENNAGAAVYTASATDPDGDSLSFYLSGVGSADFVIHASTGVVSLSAALDYEVKSSYVLGVEVRDGQGGTASTTLNVTVSDANDSPVFVGTPYSAMVAEDVNVGHTVFRSSAVDEDASDTLTYTLSGTNSTHFTMATSTGIITTAEGLDYESLTSYTLTITVSDGTASVTQPITITVIDSNDLPLFVDAPFSASVNENTTTVSLLTLTATDEDSSDMLTFSLLGPGSELFSIHPTSGVVSVTSALDAEVTSLYVLTVRVSDGKGGVNTSSLSVTVIDVNDRPAFVGAPYAASVSERLPSGTGVVTLIATDQDGDSLTYSISGTNHGHFSISPSTGLIQTAQILDYESVNSYTLTASVTDGSVTVTTSVTISVTNTNDPPTLSSSYYNVSINENDAALSVIDITGSDSDGDTLTYSLTGTGSGDFSMNSATGLITLATALDYESRSAYSLTIRVTDTKEGVVTASLFVTVVDQNDTPVLTGSPYTARIEENLSSGGVVAHVVASDQDSADTMNYTLSGTNSAHFSISSAGVITSARVLDYESVSAYTLGVQVTDGTATASTTVTVTVVDANDAPVFSNSTFTAQVSENDAGAAVCTVSATDADSGPADTLTYTLYGASSSQFSLHASTGVVTLSNVLDYEEASQHVLTVRVSDGRGGTVSTSLTIKVQNQNDPPVFRGTPYTTSIDENLSAGSSVFVAIATDEDNGDTCTYSISGVNSSDFTMASATGILTTLKVLDFEQLNSYSLTVTVTDSTSSVSQPITITVSDVNDSPGFLDAPYSISVQENSINASLCTVSASDEDNDTLSYSLTGSGASYFTIHSATGLVTLAKSLNYEGSSMFSLTVIVSDVQGASNTSTLTVNVLDVNDEPQFINSPYSVSIRENLATGTRVLQASAADEDTGDTLTYSLSGSNHAHFSISNTGVISTASGIDFEVVSSYSLSVAVSDGTVSVSEPVMISVENLNDSPVFTDAPYNATINENTSTATSILQVSTTDQDSDSITFSFVGVTSSDFNIHSSSGIITTAVNINYEKTAAYTLTIQADDGNGGKTLTTASITVTDLNDERPTFASASYTGHVVENAASGTSVIVVTATDLDVADSTLAYSLSGASSSHFNVTSEGLISTAAAIDYESLTSYSLTLTASDGAGNTGTTTINIAVVNVIDNDPVFGSVSYSANAFEDSVAGTSVTRITATDADIGDVITYSLSGPESTNFTINVNTGVISTNSAFDRESKDTYTFTITATDTGSRPDTAIVTIAISDVNDNSPVCSQAMYTASVLESVAVGSSVLTVSCPDLDIGANGEVSYSVVSGDGGAFALNSSTGILSTTSPLNYETTMRYTLSIQASDGGTPGKASTTLAVIDVQGVNEYTPSFIPNNTYELSLAEDLSVGHDVILVTASDADAGSQGEVTYSITSGDTYGNFAIDRARGLIELRSMLDYELISQIVLIIAATDGDPLSPNSATASLTINVVDVNDNYPSCNPALLTPAVPESAAVGSMLASLNCSDTDSGLNGQLTYTFVSGNTAGNFNVSTAGVVSLATALDYESTRLYSLVLSVTDSGLSTKSTQISVKVTVIAVNEFSPVFTSGGTYAVTVSEHTSLGTELIRVTANDADLNTHAHGMITYSIISGNTGSHFYVATDTGAIHLMKVLDRETVASYSLIVQATDGENNVNATVALTISDVNDNDPACSPTSYAATVREDAGLGTSLVRVLCLDSDEGNNGLLAFSITAGNTNTDFTIDANGTISTARALDYETTTSYTLTVKSRDSSSPISSQRSVNVEVTIDVIAVNEHAPVFTSASYAQSIAEDTAIGTSILMVTATDGDNGPQGHVVYSLLPLNAPFYIDTISGIIRVKSSLDRETTASYTLTVSAHDKDPVTADVKTTNVTVSVDVTDVNDNEPAFSPAHYTLTFAENTTVGTSITQLQCTDSDLGTNAALSYSITDGDPNSVFTVSSSGELTTVKQLDYETTQSYAITIQARDTSASQLMAVSHVDVIVQALNEYTPSFSQSEYNVTISEATPIGTTVIDIDASDNDSGPQGELTYSMPSGSPFYIDSLSGVITLKQGLDYEAVTSYVLLVTATDGDASSPKSSMVNVTVTVKDENDNEPTFTPAVYSVVIPENTTVGTSILSLTCTDSDSGTNGQFKMAIISGNTGTGFAISDAGVLTVATALDVETTGAYSLVVRARDQHALSPQESTAAVSVIITDVNEHTPQFTSGGSYTAVIAEDAPVGSFVTNVTAIDNDLGLVYGVVTYTITSGNSEDKFYIRPSDGSIFVKKGLDRESTPSYSLVITASDQDPVSPKSSTATLIVTISDVNDNDPVCDPVVYSKSLVESVAIGTSVAQLACSDRDLVPNVVSSYAISSGNTSLFGVSGNGLVTTLGLFDYETVKSYILVVTVTDGGLVTQRSTQVAISVQITGANEYEPAFSQPTYSVTHQEDTAIGVTIATVAATDADHGSDGAISFAIIAGNEEDKFLIDTTSGVIELKRPLDRESTGSYILTVLARDHGSPNKSSNASVDVTVVDVNDNAPNCSVTAHVVEVAENASVGSTVLELRCEDVDEGANSQLTYNITTGNTNSDFTLNSSSGVLTVASQLNRESTVYYDLTVTITDSGTPPLTTLVSIGLVITAANEFTPTFSNSTYNISLSEDVSLGTTVFIAHAQDYDDGEHGHVTYAILSGNTADTFLLDKYSGSLQLLRSLDYEVASSYKLIIEASDGAEVSVRKSSRITVNIAVIDLNDNKPECSETTKHVSLLESVVVGTVIFSTNCSDSDSSDNALLTYQILTGNAEGKFNVTSGGEVTLASGLSVEMTSWYHLVVAVRDAGSPSRAVNVSLTVEVLPVNEFVPTFAAGGDLYSLNVFENVTLGTIVFQAQVQDNDTGLHGTLRFSLVSGNDQGCFYLEPSSGMLVLVSPLDRETVDHYSVMVKVEDSSQSDPDVRSSNVTVAITVLDVNDNDPECVPALYSADISEATAAETAIINVTCSDTDLGPNSQLSYEIIRGNTGNKFRLDNHTVVVAGQLDHDTTKDYSLEVRVSDNGVTSRVTVAVVTVHVTAENEHTPVFQFMNYSVSISEWAAVGSPVFDANASDADTGIHGNLEYYVTSGLNGGVDFTIDKSSGVVAVGSSLDRETRDLYELNITVRDRGNTEQERRAAVMQLTIEVTDENDNPPVFTQEIYTTTIPENMASGASVARVATTDRDIGINANHTYSITGGDGLGKFSIVQSTGVITALPGLDYETKYTYYLSITARDRGSPQLYAVAGVRIFLSDTNDNKPVFSPTLYLTSISEATSAGTDVIPVHATDVDTGINAEITYSIVGGDAKNQFSVNSTGMIRTIATLDREDIASYTLLVQASDRGVPPQTETVHVTVTILDVNDNAAVFSQSAFSARVLEDAPVGFRFMNISASDADSGDNARLTYSIQSGNTDNVVAIESATGALYSVGAFDRERTATYTLAIRAIDAGNPPLFSTITAHIVIIDRNDNTPTFLDADYNFVVTENQPGGLSIGHVRAIDIDNGTHAQLVYTIEPSPNSNHFTMNPITGGLFTAMALDRENVPYYRLTVRVTDSAAYPSQLFNTTTVHITVLDLNDNPPAFDKAVFNASIAENSESGASVTRVTASDRDRDANARLTYSLTYNASSPEYFRLDEATGEVFLKSGVDYENVQIIEVTVTAKDDGFPSLSGSTTLRVHVIDLNDNAPVFSATFYETEIRSDHNLGPPAIITLTAIDRDSGPNSAVTYELEQTQEKFKLDTNSGEIVLKASPGAGQIYSFRARAKDSGSPQLSSSYVNVRVDTIDAEQTMVDIELDITQEEFDANREYFIKKLSELLGAEVKIAKVQSNDEVSKRKRREVMSTGNLGESESDRDRRVRREVATTAAPTQAAKTKRDIKVTIYAVSNPTTNSTDLQTRVSQAKRYLTKDTIMKALLDENGNLKPEITSNSTGLNIFKIKTVTETKPTVPPTAAFMSTTEGYLTVGAAPLLLVIIIAAVLLWRRKTRRRELREQLREPRIRPRKGVVDSDFQIYKPRVDHTKVMNLPPSGTVIKVGQESKRFDGKAVDPVSGRAYAFNKVTGERMWLEDRAGVRAVYSQSRHHRPPKQQSLAQSNSNFGMEPVFERHHKKPGNYDHMQLPGTPE